MRTRTLFAGLLCASMTIGVHAGGGGGIFAEVDELGGALLMMPRSLGTVFGTGPTEFTTGALSAFHTELQGSAINTNGKVTFMLAETDRGISWVVLVDDQNQPGNPGAPDSGLGMTTAGPSVASIYVNDDASDILFRQDLGNGFFLAAGEFGWDSAAEGRGFAWTDLDIGHFVSFNFSRGVGPGITSPDAFQFVSWTGSTWEVVAVRDFTSNNQYAFTFTIVPAPGALAMLAIGVLGVRRRRRR